MSQYSIYFKVPDYLDQWLRHDFWNPVSHRVEFQRGSNIHSTFSTFLRREPAGYDRGDVDGLLPIEVPTFKGMNPAQHNYLTVEGKKAVVSAIKRNFKRVLEKELSVFFLQDVCITDIVFAFMAKHGISDDPKNFEAIRQMYYRIKGRSITPQR